MGTRQPSETVVLHTGGLLYSGEGAIVERALGKYSGVDKVEANAVSQTSTVTFDPSQASVAELKNCVEQCGYQCAGQSVPTNLGDPSEESVTAQDHGAHPGHTTPAMAHKRPGQMVTSPVEAMGHGGHAGMSMESMVRDMPNRFLVAAVLWVPILLWSSIGRNVLHFTAPAPFGLRDDVFQLVLSLPVVFYSSWRPWPSQKTKIRPWSSRPSDPKTTSLTFRSMSEMK